MTVADGGLQVLGPRRISAVVQIKLFPALGFSLTIALAGPAALSAQEGQAIAPPPVIAPFDADLQRLAEIFGALHHLRAVCGADEGQKWRQEMQALIDVEAPSGERRARIVAAFNRGYRDFQQSYRTCTRSAEVAIRRYLAEGAKIARDMTGRYGN